MHTILRRVNSTLETGSNIVGSQISRQVALRDSRETPGELDNVVVAVSERPLAAMSQTTQQQQAQYKNVLILHHAVLKIISTSIKCGCYANKMHSGQNITNFSIQYTYHYNGSTCNRVRHNFLSGFGTNAVQKQPTHCQYL